MFLCNCVGKYVERLRGADKKIETFPCPTCHSEFTLKSNQDVAELPSSHFIKNMLDIMETQSKAKASSSCSRCENPAINHCISCEMFMCKTCSKWHDGWPCHKDHTVLSTEELSNPESQVKMRRRLYCTGHKDEILKYFCQTCKELCCIDCVVLNHTKPDHSCMAVNEIAQKQRETLQSSCTTLDEKVSEGKKALNNICEVMKILEKNTKAAKDQIKEEKKNILKMVEEKVNEKEKKMNAEVDEVYSEMHKELSKQHDEIKEYLDKVQASVSLPNSLLKRGSIEEILSSQKLVDENIEKLTKEKPDDLTSVNDGVIRYVPGDIGNINVDEIVGKLGYIKGMYYVMYI